MAGDNMAVPDWPGNTPGDEGHARIAACLVMDIQHAPGWAKTVLQSIDDVMAGRSRRWEMSMNAYVLDVGPAKSDIEPVYEEQGEETVTVLTADLRCALAAWLEQIDQPQSE